MYAGPTDRYCMTFFVTKIVIEGVRGASYVSDVAVDDVSLRPGECSRLPKLEPGKPHSL